MIGVIGVAPEKGKSVPCGYPGSHGGNLDCKLMVKGNTAYFPVRVEGGLVQMGDMHAVMGDSELCGTGLEINGTVIARVSVIKNCPLEWPVLETADTWYTMASAADGALAEATSHQDVITTTQYVVQQMQTMSDPAGLTTVNAMLQELETTMDQIQQALRVTDASYIIYKTQNYLVFNYAAGSFVQQIGLKRVIVEMAVFVVLCFGLCMVRTARQIRKEEQR